MVDPRVYSLRFFYLPIVIEIINAVHWQVETCQAWISRFEVSERKRKKIERERKKDRKKEKEKEKEKKERKKKRKKERKREKRKKEKEEESVPTYFLIIGFLEDEVNFL